MVVQAVIGWLTGLTLIGWAVRVLVRGDVPVIRATGRAWRSATEAAVFWLLLGLAVLVGPAVVTGAAAGWVGPEAGFWLLFLPVPLVGLALTWFRPRKAYARR
jgi:hypothetical protein